jgi:hypothetical protein
MGVISTAKVVTGSERRSRPKAVQPGNREWVTVIQGVKQWRIDLRFSSPRMLLFERQMKPHHAENNAKKSGFSSVVALRYRRDRI